VVFYKARPHIHPHSSVLLSHTTLQDFFGKSDPYLEFSKENSDGSFTPVHKTEVHTPFSS